MTDWTVDIAIAARHDIRDVLRWTTSNLGNSQAALHRERIRAAVRDLRDGPDRIRTLPVAGHPSIRRLPLRRPSCHARFYRAEPGRILVLRLLYEAMDPTRHLPED
ncbi:type II toxin-antitoxin system RelE/ParE family toxin [Falsiroseomonas sp. HW251]|uniref:type II toxin-antitoxin system RelE/ParE family toxin n=1 Tax=Falsiroseomonas sp. HW251 TaxID=3390998 RepID=UPI003D311EB3